MAHEPSTPSASDHANSGSGQLKVERRRKGRSKVTMLGLRDLWLIPFLAEVVLMFGAGWLTYCLLRVVQVPDSVFPLGSVVVLAAAYALLAIYSRLHELFLPRKVVLLGIGSLLLGSAITAGLILTDAYLMGGRARLLNAALSLTPLHIFILRCLMIFREARFTPAADVLPIRVHSKSERIERLRRKLHFWLS